MIAVIFEVTPTTEGKAAYLDIAAELRPLLDDIEGFISIERFQSLVNPNKLLSLSFWENDEAITQWRELEAHRAAQYKGKTQLFQSYHIRVAGVIRDYAMDK